MWQSPEILNVFSTLTLKPIFWKTKTFSKKLEYHFEVKILRLKRHHLYKTAMSEASVKTKKKRWGLQNDPITKNGFLPVTTLFFWKFLRTSYKELIWCTHTSILKHFVSAGSLFKGALSLLWTTWLIKLRSIENKLRHRLKAF